MLDYGSIYQQYARLLAYYETSAENVRAAIRSLARGELDRAPMPGWAATVRAAATLEASARVVDQWADQHAAPRRARGLSRATRERRAQTIRALAQFDRHEPRRREDLRIPVPGIGSLVRRGYLIRKGNGYIRSAKPYRLNPTGPA